jgi:hypothetical protein
MTKPVEQSASDAFGAEHLGPFGKRQKLEVLRDQEVGQPGDAKFTALCRVVARMATERRVLAEGGSGHTVAADLLSSRRFLSPPVV